MDRLRRGRVYKNRARFDKTWLNFHNPYPWMSEVEAMVHLELEHRHIPFSWRYFDGSDAPNFTQLMPGFAPEFTLRDYHIVILIAGAYFGTLPGVLDKNALAQVLLEADGWKVATWFDQEIRAGVAALIDKTFPELVRPAVVGPERPSPYGLPTYLLRLKQYLRGNQLLRRKFKLDKQERDASERSSNHRRHRRFGGTEGGRYHPLK